MPLTPADRLQIIKHFEVLTSENGEKKLETWLYIRHPSGASGYVRGKDLVFKNTEHATVLRDYYQKPPIWKPDWHSRQNFVKVN